MGFLDLKLFQYHLILIFQWFDDGRRVSRQYILMSIASTFMNIEENPRSVYASEENLKVSIHLTGIESSTGERVVSVCVCVLCFGIHRS